MRIEFLMLADAVQTAGGKLYILGGAWDRFQTNAFPAATQMAIAASLLLGWEESGMKHAMTISIADEKGIPIIPPMEGVIEVGRPVDVKPADQRAVIGINATIPIKEPGRYFVQLVAGGETVTTSFEAVFVGKRVDI
jgi:hypothetical protein